MDDIESKLKSRAVETPDGLMVRLEDAVLYGVLKAREGYARRAAETSADSETRGRAVAAATRVYPLPALPTRTRTVLREEPVPGTNWPKYRWSEGRLEVVYNAAWRLESAALVTNNLPLLRHALDLADHPTRTVEVPVDEADPWGERG